MSIIKKERTTEEYKKRIQNQPSNTYRNKIQSIKYFQKFVAEKYNTIPEELCKELLILKKQNEEEYTYNLYDMLQEYVNYCATKIGAYTLKTRFSNLRQYLYFLGIKTDQQDVNQLITFPKRIREEKIPLDHEQLKRMLEDQSRNPKRKALWLACSSSGMRIGEAVQITKKDLEFKNRIQVNIKSVEGNKSGARSVFISKECQKVLETYIDDLEEDEPIFTNKRSTQQSKITHEEHMLIATLERLKMSKKYSSNNHHHITTHSFRAFFFTQAVRKHGENYAHRMTGHGGYLIQYDRMTIEEKLQMYIDLEPELVIFDTTKQQLENEKLKRNQDLALKQVKDEIELLKNELSRQDDERIVKLINEGKLEVM